MRRTTLALALTAAGLFAVPAVADTPKQGVYIDVPKQVYVTVTKARTAIKAFQGQCNVQNQAGATVPSGSMYLGKNARVKVSRKGRFSYNGTALIAGSSGPVKIKMKITGSFTGGKAKGSYEPASKGVTCQPTTFSAKYYGVNPKG